MEIVLRALVVFFFLWLVTRAIGRATLGELSTFQLLIYVTMGDLIQQAVTQQDYSVTAGLLAVSTMALMTVAIGWVQWRFPRVRPLTAGRPVLVWRNGAPVEDVLRDERLDIADVLVAAREQGIRRTDEIEFAVLEDDGKISFFTFEEPSEGAAETAPET
jgi:uncharacterized membrane protein YcaP (DUF421 family)